VDDALGQNLSALMFDGPDTDLNLSEDTQRARVAVSVAIARVLQEAKPDLLTIANCKFVAGHSLGEYCAVSASDAYTPVDAATLLNVRGQAMEKAAHVGVGAMAAILGLELPDVMAIAKAASNHEIVSSANDNSYGQVVVSGHKAAVEKAVALATEKGAKRAILL